MYSLYLILFVFCSFLTKCLTLKKSVLVEKVNTIFLCDDDISDLMSPKLRHHEQINSTFSAELDSILQIAKPADLSRHFKSKNHTSKLPRVLYHNIQIFEAWCLWMHGETEITFILRECVESAWQKIKGHSWITCKEIRYYLRFTLLYT